MILMNLISSPRTPWPRVRRDLLTRRDERISDSRKWVMPKVRGPTGHSRQTLLFLIQNHDRYGVWYSTQATVNVLDALLSASSSSQGSGNSNSIEITINGKAAQRVTMPSDRRMMAPLYIDFSSAIINSNNQIEFHRSGSGSP